MRAPGTADESRPRRTRRRAVGAAAGAVVVAAAAVAVSSAGSSGAAPAVTLHPGGSAYAFELASVLPGGPVRLAAASGRPVLLSFFASWCDDCRQEMATMAALAGATGTRAQLIGVDVDDESGAARQLLARNHIDYPVGADHDDAVAERYGLVGLPTTVFLDAAHHIVGRTVGPLTQSSGRAWLAAIERAAA